MHLEYLFDSQDVLETFLVTMSICTYLEAVGLEEYH